MKTDITDVGFALEKATSMNVEELLEGDRFCLVAHKHEQAGMGFIGLFES